MFFFYLFSCESAALCTDLFNHHPGYNLKCCLIIHLFGSSKSQQLKKGWVTPPQTIPSPWSTVSWGLNKAGSTRCW